MKKIKLGVSLITCFSLIACSATEENRENNDSNEKIEVKENNSKSEELNIIGTEVECKEFTCTIIDWTVISEDSNVWNEDYFNDELYSKNKPNTSIAILYKITKNSPNDVEITSPYVYAYNLNQDDENIIITNSLDRISVHEKLLFTEYPLSDLTLSSENRYGNEGVYDIYEIKVYKLNSDTSPVVLSSKKNSNQSEKLDITDKNHFYNNLKEIRKPNKEQMIDICSVVKGIDRSLLTIKNENSDGSFDIKIETLDAYVNVKIEGDYIFYSEIFNDRVLSTIKYNIINKEIIYE